MKEATKAYERRKTDPRFAQWFAGRVLDIGCGRDLMPCAAFPLVTEVVGYDLILGHKDAQALPEIADASFETVHASHCLEHLRNPWEAVSRWLEVLKPGGRLVVTIPDFDLYEQGTWPSTFNRDHKWCFSISPSVYRNRKHLSVSKLVGAFVEDGEATLELLALRGEGFDHSGPRRDQSRGPCECAIEFVLRRTPTEK